MWTEALLVVDADRGVSVPRWLERSDEEWLATLLDVRRSLTGRPRAELDERLRDPLGVETSVAKFGAAVRVLSSLGASSAKPPAPPRELRTALFVAAASGAAQPRTNLIEQVARRFDLPVAEVEHLLLSDLASMRALPEIPSWVTPAALARRINHEMAKGFVSKATTVHVEAQGNVRPLLRHAKARGLIAVVPSGQFRPGESAAIEISGPFSLFRHTAIYARALGGIVPALQGTRRFRVRARVDLEYRTSLVEIVSGDPVFDERAEDAAIPGPPPRLLRQLERLAPLWEVVTDPDPLDANGVLVFPDFTLVHRVDGRRVSVEIAGFWTPDTIRARLLRLRNGGLGESYLLCVDDERNCAEREPPAHRALLRFRRQLDASELLRAVESRMAAVVESS